MNTLSLFFLLAHILSALNVMLVLAAFGVALYLFAGFDKSGRSDHPFYSTFKQRKDAKPFWIILFVLTFFAAIIPSQKTIYLIAASEMGETVYKSEEAKQLYGDLREIIKSYAYKETKTETK